MDLVSNLVPLTENLKSTAHFIFEKMDEKKNRYPQEGSPHDFISVRSAIHCTGRRRASESGSVLVDKAPRGSMRIECPRGISKW